MKYLLLSLLLQPFLLHAQQASTYKDPRDGQIYSTITIGNQTWMAENMRYNAPGSFLDSNQTNIKIGRLYNFEQVKKACPKGWHLPTDKEWSILEMKLGLPSSDVEIEDFRGTHANEMKAIGAWLYDEDANNKSGFSALPSGFLNKEGDFLMPDILTFFWTSTTLGTSSAMNRYIATRNPAVFKGHNLLAYSLSCRCVKD